MSAPTANTSEADRPRCGALWEGSGTRFTLRSQRATAAQVCLHDEAGGELGRYPMRRSGDLWSLRLKGVGPGQLYGYRVDGPWAPLTGDRFNPAKLLVDPWARAVSGELTWDGAIFDHEPAAAGEWLRNDLDSAGSVPLSVVVDPRFDWRGDRRPGTAWSDTLIYEAHVRGLTRRHPEVPESLRGSYLGLAHEAVLEHLGSLGVTAVELMPVQHFTSERELMARGLRNYWGYNPLAWFAPHAAYAGGDRGEQVAEFRTMVRRLHRAGFEVLVDVVFNHSMEGDERGPTVSLRGIDNRSYYRPRAGEAGRSENWTGCGNTLDASRVEVVDLIHDCLRYWVEELHVDGFRFDLAPVLGRDPALFDAGAPLFERLAADPLFDRVKLIAEPWDLGPEGYALGGFPEGWAEWNDRFRDAARRFWRGDVGSAPELRQALLGAPEIFAPRGACASINYVAAHDGFTLADLVSYERKHNLANGEEDRDGSDHEISANWGVEGPTADPAIAAVRRRVERALMATLALARGVPMLAHGDELGRSQRGNNNAYCQDNEISWLDWELDAADRERLEFARRVLALRRRLAATGCGAPPGRTTELEPLPADRPDRALESEPLCVGLLLDERRRDTAVSGQGLIVLANGGAAPREFELPPRADGAPWRLLLDTSRESAGAVTRDCEVTGRVRVEARSLVALGGARGGS